MPSRLLEEASALDGWDNNRYTASSFLRCAPPPFPCGTQCQPQGGTCDAYSNTADARGSGLGDPSTPSVVQTRTGVCLVRINDDLGIRAVSSPRCARSSARLQDVGTEMTSGDKC
ncbi:hypothetical protein L227DRAFT_573110, partial [Lentinus tigrinus ALCF2SS1-6]